MTITELLNELPYNIRKRYESLRLYAEDYLYPKRFRKRNISKEEHNRMNIHIENATILLILYLLKVMFYEGHKAAITTVDILKELDIDGFKVGSVSFKDRNENVMRGQMLAEKLIDSISDANIKDVIITSKTMKDILHYYKQNIING